MIGVDEARRNIRIQGWVNALTGATFLVPVITLLYTQTGLSIPDIIIVANVSTFCVWLLEIPTSVFADTTGRKLSLLLSVASNFLGALTILLFPCFPGFLIASVFAALYWSFWSGTGQAFLAENLRVLNRPQDFGRVIGRFMSFEQTAQLMTPFIASCILYASPTHGFRILAALDVVFAGILVMMVHQYTETLPPRAKTSFSGLLRENIRTAADALRAVIAKPSLRFLLLYRSLANHVAYFPLLILPILAADGMPQWAAGVIMALAALGMICGTKFAYLIGERFSYSTAWMTGTIAQGFLLLCAGIVLDSWIPLVAIFVLFSACDGLWQPSWNHVLVGETEGKAVATIRSIVFSVFALYTTIGKQILALIPIQYALIGLGAFILIVNVLLGKRMMKLKGV